MNTVLTNTITSVSVEDSLAQHKLVVNDGIIVKKDGVFKDVLIEHQLLNPVYNGNGNAFSDNWTFSNISNGITSISQPYFENDGWFCDFYYEPSDTLITAGPINNEINDSILEFKWIEEDVSIGFVATRIPNLIIGYTLGSQIPKLQIMGNYINLLDEQPTTPKEGDLYPVADGYALWADGKANLLKGMTETEASQMDSLQIQLDDEHAAIIQLGGLIPPQASTSNQLADKAFVNSSVQTATANFRGNWTTWNDVPDQSEYYPVDYAGSRTPTVNDYMVVQDASGYTGSQTLEGTWRFKYSGEWSVDNLGGWLPEYQVNETPMTAAQLAALNSNITAAKVAQYDNTIGNINYALVTVVESAGIYSIQDRAVNTISITSSDFPIINFDFPSPISGHARDLIVRVVAAAGTYDTQPTFVSTGITFMSPDGTLPEIATDATTSKTTLLYFSEIAANIFLIKGETLEAVP